LLELLELVGDQPANHFAIGKRDEDGDMRFRQQPPEIVVVGRRALERLGLGEGFAEQAVERADFREIARPELRDADRQSTTAVPLTLTISIEPFWPSTS
jgi:hypothetical protein